MPKRDRRYRRLSVKGPVTLIVVVLVLIIILTVLWHVTLVNDYRKLKALAASETFHWSFILLGSVLFTGIIVILSLIGAQLIGHIRWSQRQSNFIASVSHELNSPLSSIKLFAQTLRQPDMNLDDRLNFVEKILSDVERLRRLISNILRAAEVDNRGEVLPVVPRRVELASYLSDYVTDIVALRPEHGLTIEIHVEPENWVMLDPGTFRQVLDNLIDNAIRYRGDGPPRVEIRLEENDEFLELTVSDHGIGVEVSELPSLFDRFYQVSDDHAHGGRQGTGIGLFVVRSIVRSHGGQVEAWSEGLGHGTEIRIQLPLPAGEASPQLSRPPSPSARKALELESHSAG